jgi:hypothetical protein
MRKKILQKLCILSLVSVAFLQSCRDDSYVLQDPPVPNQSFSEEFDSLDAALARGWKTINNSFPIGGGDGVWQNGGGLFPIFSAYSQQGAFAGFAGATYLSTSAGQGVISNWLISPPVHMQNGDKIIFYTRAQIGPGLVAGDSTDWANRLQVRINRTGLDYEVGSVKELYEWLFTPSPNVAYDNPGQFDLSLLDINSQQYEWHKVVPGMGTFKPYDATTNILAYPIQWTKFEATVSGLSKPTVGRFAFRYFIEGAGNNGLGNGVGIDKMQYVSVSQ